MTAKNPSNYLSMYALYKNAYKLLSNENDIDISNLTSPDDLFEYILDYDRQIWGIFIVPHNIHDLVFIKDSYNKMLELLKEKQSTLDYKSLLPNINYIPVNIKDNFYKLFLNMPHNCQSIESITVSKILKSITNYADKYGMPFWTNRTDIAEIAYVNQPKPGPDDLIATPVMEGEEAIPSAYSFSNNIIPIQNLLLISLLIYLYKGLGEHFNDGKYDTDLNEFRNTFSLLGINIDYMTSQKKALKKLFENAGIIDDYIFTCCNSIYDYQLKVYREKTCKGQDFYNEKVYESVAIAAWDIFYLDYLGNSEFKNLKPYCSHCGKQITEKAHTTRDGSNLSFCEDCFNIRRKEQTKIRVNRCRS